MTFVTFNYDRVLEKYFDTVIENMFGLAASDASALRERAIPIIHLHGKIVKRDFGDYEESAVVGSLSSIASEISVVHDTVPMNDPIFKQAFGAISRARLICFLGFGYHPVNIERLRIHELASDNVSIIGSTYGMGEAEVRLAQGRLQRQLHASSTSHKCREFLRARAQLL